MTDLTPVIQWLENGCNVADAIRELKLIRAALTQPAQPASPEQAQHLLYEDGSPGPVEQAQQPSTVTLYASPVQLAAAMRGELVGMDTDSYRNGEFGAYLPVRHTPAGKFTQAVTLTSGQQPSGGEVVVAKRLVELADIMRDCGRLVSKSGAAEACLREAARMLANPKPEPQSGGEVVSKEWVMRMLDVLICEEALPPKSLELLQSLVATKPAPIMVMLAEIGEWDHRGKSVSEVWDEIHGAGAFAQATNGANHG